MRAGQLVVFLVERAACDEDLNQARDPYWFVALRRPFWAAAR
jgi:hypothetical protein